MSLGKLIKIAGLPSDVESDLIITKMCVCVSQYEFIPHSICPDFVHEHFRTCTDTYMYIYTGAGGGAGGYVNIKLMNKGLMFISRVAPPTDVKECFCQGN